MLFVIPAKQKPKAKLIVIHENLFEKRCKTGLVQSIEHLVKGDHLFFFGLVVLALWHFGNCGLGSRQVRSRLELGGRLQ
jgi:hypothetical protein